MTNERAVKAVAYGSVLLGLVMVAIMVGVWYLTIFHDNPALEVMQPVTTDRLRYEPGEIIKVAFDYCKYTDSVGVLSYSFVSHDDAWPMTTLTLPYAPTGCRFRDINVRLPVDMPPGMYRWHGTIVYRVNVLSERVTDFYTNEFEVTR